jgi:hypothetical protein
MGAQAHCLVAIGGSLLCSIPNVLRAVADLGRNIWGGESAKCRVIFFGSSNKMTPSKIQARICTSSCTFTPLYLKNESICFSLTIACLLHSKNNL